MYRSCIAGLYGRFIFRFLKEKTMLENSLCFNGMAMDPKILSTGPNSERYSFKKLLFEEKKVKF
jgi:hypothetical protein